MSRSPEFPFASWPVARAEMRAPKAIRRRMAQDLNDLRRQSGGVDILQLIERGWSARQVNAHAMHAVDYASAAWSETRQTVRHAVAA